MFVVPCFGILRLLQWLKIEFKLEIKETQFGAPISML